MRKKAEGEPSLSQNVAKLAALGWSVIPLHGDLLPGGEKAPALPTWAEYQRRAPTADERDLWFNVYGFRAAGVVLGAVSGVVVVDIDCPQAAVEFAHTLPELTQTFTVRSGNRGLPHYYYQLDPTVPVPSIRSRAIELRADGHYVVAPDVCINGKTWQVTDSRLPRTLSASDLSRLLDFIHTTRGETAKNGAKSPLNAILDDARQDAPTHRLSKSALLRRYRRLAPQVGRNNALFNCACLARDAGWSASDFGAALTPFHITQPAHDANHAYQSPASRASEASRTIASAYTRPARPMELTTACNGLPNAVREALIQRGMVNVARLLDGLLMCGYRPGDGVTVPYIINLLAPLGVGRNSVYAALGQLPPQTPPANADGRAAVDTKQCLFGRVTNPVKNMRGRPAARFTVPTLTALCGWLNVENRGGDALTTAALRSPAAYRAALHAALIRRQPGAYTRRWQSARLGVSVQSCRRYDRRCGITVAPRFHETRITWANVQTAICAEQLPGHFLMDNTGRRYPAIVAIAQRLLKGGRAISLLAQGANYYGVAVLPTAPAQPAAMPAQQTFASVADVPISPARKKSTSPPITSPQPILIPSPQTAMQTQSHTTPHLSSNGRDVDAVAHLYNALKAINPSRAITRKTARAWVKAFGAVAIRKGLTVLSKRQSIVNAPGFLVTYLRSTTGVSVPIQNTKKSQVQIEEESYAAWQEAMRQSPYAHFFVNAEDVLEGLAEG